MPNDSRAARNEHLRGRLTEDLLDKVRRLPIADDLASPAPNWPWPDSAPFEVTAVITGATKPEHVAGNRAAGVALTPDVVAIDAICLACHQPSDNDSALRALSLFQRVSCSVATR